MNEDKSYTQRLIMFTVICMVLIGIFMFFGPKKTSQRNNQKETQTEKKIISEKIPKKTVSDIDRFDKRKKIDTSISDISSSDLFIKNVRKKEKIQTLQIGSSRYYFSNFNGNIKTAEFTQYKEYPRLSHSFDWKAKKNDMVFRNTEFKSCRIIVDKLYIEDYFEYDVNIFTDKKIIFQKENLKLQTKETKKTIRLSIYKKYTFIDEYRYSIEISIKGLEKTKIPVHIAWDGHIGPYGNGKGMYNEVVQSYLEKKYEASNDLKHEKVKYEKNNNSQTYIIQKNPIQIIAQANRYCAFGVSIEKANAKAVIFTKPSEKSKDRSLNKMKIELNGYTTVFSVFNGPKIRNKLIQFHADFKEVMDMWLINQIMVLVFRNVIKTIAMGISKIGLGNWSYGLAIVFLTILLKIAISPLTKSTMASSQKMQAIKPQVDRIRLQYKDNPQKMNQEIMDLYKKEKINPVGGCLPMFIQLPILFGLFRTIPLMLELRHSGFLWIHDLAQPDTLFKFGQKIPLVGWEGFNLLPILMTGCSIAQQKLSPMASTDAQSKNMMMIMPVVFLFMLWNMPSGLTLYWTTQSLASIIAVLGVKIWKDKISGNGNIKTV